MADSKAASETQALHKSMPRPPIPLTIWVLGFVSLFLAAGAFGVFNLLNGISMLAGWLWQAYSAAVTFYAGAAISALALLLLLLKLSVYRL